jgi:hypothetical protein
VLDNHRTCSKAFGLWIKPAIPLALQQATRELKSGFEKYRTIPGLHRKPLIMGPLLDRRKSIGQRLTGSANFEPAANWAVSEAVSVCDRNDFCHGRFSSSPAKRFNKGISTEEKQNLDLILGTQFAKPQTLTTETCTSVLCENLHSASSLPFQPSPLTIVRPIIAIRNMHIQ